MYNKFSKRKCRKDYQPLTPFDLVLIQRFPFIEEDFDGMNQYGLISKIKDKLNDIIKNEQILTQNVENLSQNFDDLQNYVETYFTNLDVQEEINNKLDEMNESGELAEILNTYLENNELKLKIIFPKFWQNTRSGDISILKYGDINIVIDCHRLTNWLQVKNMLDDNDVSHIDYFILTHYHLDHDGNFENLIASGYIDSNTHLYLPAELISYGISEKIEQIKTICNENNLNYYTPYDLEKVNIDENFSFTFTNCDVATVESYYTGSDKNLNSASTVVLFEHKNVKALFSADAQKSTLKYLYDNKFALTKLDLYKVEHHAINTGTYEQYIKAINPKYSVILDGIVDFSMNNESICATTSILQQMNSVLFNTCLQDDYLIFGSNGKDIQVINGVVSNFNATGDNQNIYVDSTVSNNNIQDGSQQHPYKDLTTALCMISNNSKLNYTIHLADGIYGYSQTDTTLTNAKNIINIKSMSNITITGNSNDRTKVKLNGLTITNSNVNIQNLTIDNRYHEGIVAFSSDVNVENCEITSLDSEVSEKVGVILRNNSSISLYNTKIDYCNSAIHVREGSSLTTRNLTYGSHNNHFIYNDYGKISEINIPTYEDANQKLDDLIHKTNFNRPVFLYNGQNSDSDYTDSQVELPVNITDFDVIDIQTVTKDDYRINNSRLVKLANNDTFDLFNIYKAQADIKIVGVRVKITENNKLVYGNPFKITINGTTGEKTIDITNRNIKIRYIYAYNNPPFNIT